MSKRATLHRAGHRRGVAVAALRQGNHAVLRGFTKAEAGLLVALLRRLIANLDQLTNADASPEP